MKSQLSQVTASGETYTVLRFICPGCATWDGATGFHMIPVNSDHNPSWHFNGNLEAPTLSPSLLSTGGQNRICHSYLRDGVFNFLADSTHELAGQKVPMPDLPDWLIK